MRLAQLIAIICLGFSGSACWADVDTDPSGAGPEVEQARPSGSPMSQEFRAEISGLKSAGLALKESFVTSLDGTSSHLVAIFERAEPKSPNEAYELRIIESDGKTAKTIFRRAEFYFTFETDELGKLNLTDINGDGAKEIIVQSSSGGNCWSCNPTEIYRVKNHKAELLAAGPVRKIADLNGDGPMEIVLSDARWELYGELSHAASPSAAVVYSWQKDRYVYASRDFAAYYKSEIDQLRAQIEEFRREITAEEFSDELYVGAAISLALNYAHAGDAARALKEMETLLESSVKTPEQAKRRREILADFRTGDSSKKLGEMRYGDPINQD